MKGLLAIDQSTSGTKALILDEQGKIVCRCDRAHKQIVFPNGWVEHDPEEIYQNTLSAAKDAIQQAGLDIIGIGISNQRETALCWDRETGKPAYHAVVWQCSRGEEICGRMERQGCGDPVRQATGIPLSPYFSGAKLAWIMENVPLAKELAQKERLCCGTVDSWLVFKLTKGAAFKTDYSNASRTQLFNIRKLQWDADVTKMFGLAVDMLPEVSDSNGLFGTTDLNGILPKAVPIHAAMGDSHAALFGQGCRRRGMIKTTYGTGSSVMMNTGAEPVFSKKGAVTSLAWGMDHQVNYVLEGNINYTGAAMKWAADLGLISSPKEAGSVAKTANPEDETYLVPAFTGLGAPYWASGAKAILYGMTRKTGKAEIIKAAEECIAYQIADLVRIMAGESGAAVESLRVDGGPTRDPYLMQFQSDILDLPVQVPQAEELSGLGAGYAAGIALGLFGDDVFDSMERKSFFPVMDPSVRAKKLAGWAEAVSKVL